MQQIKILQNVQVKGKGGSYLLGELFEFDGLFLKWLLANRINHAVINA